MNRHIRLGSLTLVLLMLWAAPVWSGEQVFGNGFESGRLCAWSQSPCTVESMLENLENAQTAEEIEAAIRSTLEATIGSIPEDVIESVEVAGELGAAYPDTRGAFLTLAQIHDVAVLSQDDAPSLSGVLSALTTHVQNAYANPTAAGSARIILMFSSTSDMTTPLPLSSDSRLTLTGSFLYASWLVETFPQSFAKAEVTPAECSLRVGLNQTAAAVQVVTRNVFILVFKATNAILNSAKAIVNCGTGGATEIAGVVIDAVKDCAVGQFLNWVEVEAEAQCIGNVPSPPAIAGCIASLVPCLGDVYSALDNALGVARAAENLVNGVCTVISSREGLHQACQAGCPECSQLNFESACGFGSILSCFDPLNNIPRVWCEPIDTPECAQHGVPKIDLVTGPSVVPGGGTVGNHLFFRDENAGISEISATAVTDNCGGCWQDSSWDPGVSTITEGSFPFEWWCVCGGDVSSFQATYHLRLHDSQGNTSAPFTRQVVCLCPSGAQDGQGDRSGPSGGGFSVGGL